MTLSLLEESQIDTLIESLRISDIESIVSIIANLRDIHVSVRGFFEQIMYRLRDQMVAHLDDGLYYEYHELYEYIETAYTRVRAIPDGMLLIEMTLLKIAKRGGIEDREQRVESRKEKEVKKETIKTDESSKMGARGKEKMKEKNGESEGDKLSESDDNNIVKSGANEFLSPSGAFGTFQS